MDISVVRCERGNNDLGGGLDVLKHHDLIGGYLRVNDSSTYLMNGERKNSITRLFPVLISAVTAIPGDIEMSLPLTGWKNAWALV